MKRLLLIILGLSLVLLTWPRHRMQYLTIDKWSGGLSDGDRLGIEGSFRFGQGLDYKTNPDAITANQALVKSSGTTVVDLPKWIIGDDEELYCLGTAGKLCKRDADGNWSVLRTVTGSTGEGLGYYSGYLYYAAATAIGRYDLASTYSDSWQTLSTASYHPIKTFMNLMLVGNGRYLATWDGSTWTAQKLTFPVNWEVRAIDVRGEYAVIAVNDNRSDRSALFYWDGASATYNFVNEITENGAIGAIKATQDGVWILMNSSGNVYLDAGRVNLVKTIPFIGSGAGVLFLPGSVANYKGDLVFGAYTTSSTTVYQGIYRLGQISKNYPLTLSFAYPISTGSVQGATKIVIGGVHVFMGKLWVGWSDSTSGSAVYGVDWISNENYQTSVTYESRILSLTRQASVRRAKLFFKPLRTGESITLKYDDDQGGTWHDFDSAVSYTSDGTITYKVLNQEFVASDMQFQITLAGTATSMPTVTKLVIEYEEEGVL